MGLTVNFECPECRKAVPRLLADLAPARQDICPECRVPVELSAASLQDFRRELGRYCRS